VSVNDLVLVQGTTGAARFVTVALAVPVLLATAAVELWVSPRLLGAPT
jgi:hypothetical protein